MVEKHGRGIGLVIPTLNAGKYWSKCLAAIEDQSLKPARLLIVDSASTDETVTLAQSAGFEVISITRAEFNHGGTRQWAAEYLDDCDVIVFLTQDAILAQPDALIQLVQCFDDQAVAVAYGRQLPHRWATPIEAHARLFNYGTTTQKKDALASKRLGSKAFFCSNSFAAYRRSTLIKLGGFRRDLILEEDAEFAARAIKCGYINLYCATALAFHSHDYTIYQQLARYFDLGVFDARHNWMQSHFGSHSSEGLRFIRSEVNYLMRHAFLQIPRALCQTFAKLIGYRLGRLERWLPNGFKRKVSMTPHFWR